jgi:hypothetical protein
MAVEVEIDVEVRKAPKFRACGITLKAYRLSR